MENIGYKKFVSTIPVDTKKVLEYAMAFFKDIEKVKIATSKKDEKGFVQFNEISDTDKAFLSIFMSLLTVKTNIKDVMNKTGVTKEDVMEFLEKNNTSLVLASNPGRLSDQEKENIYYSNFAFLKTLISDMGIETEKLTPENLAKVLLNGNVTSKIIDKFYEDEYKDFSGKKEHPSFTKVSDMSSSEVTQKKIPIDNKSEFEEFGRFIGDNPLFEFVGREKEIRSLEIALMTPSRKGAILVGERGIGKRSIVEGLAKNIKSGNVPSDLKDKVIYEVDLVSVTAGTRFRGDLEEKVNKLLSLVKNNPNIILFIPNIQEGIKNQEEEGGIDFTSIISKAILRGEASVIATTNPANYYSKSFFNSSINTILKKVTVEEPEKAITEEILLSKIPLLEKETAVAFPEEDKRNLLVRAITEITDKDKRGFASASNNPDLSVLLLERSFAIAKLNEHSILESDDVIEAIQTDEELSRDAREFASRKLESILSIQDNPKKIVTFPVKRKSQI